MPLLKDNPVLSAFRQMGWTFTKAKSRNTNGEPVRAGNLGDSFLKKIALKNKGANEILRKEWDSIIPSKFVGKCSFDNAKLTVVFARASNPAVRQELQFEERAILKKINTFPECKKINKIRFL